MDYEPLNVDKVKKTNYWFLINYVIFVGFLVSMYIGYTNMLNTMESMLKNTYAMCNMTQVLTTAPAQCFMK